MGLVSALVMLAEIGTEHPGASIVLPTVSPTRTLSRAEEAVAIARSLDWRSGEAYALLGLAYCLTGQGAYGQALDAARTGLAIAVDIEHQQWMVAGYVTIAGLYLELFAPALALQPLDQAQVIADATGSAYWLGLVTAIRAFVFWMQGDLEQTQAQLRLLPDFEDSALNPIQLFAIRGQIELALAAGYPEKALAIVDACMIAVDRTAATNQIASNILLVRGEALSRLGKNVEAEAVCHSVVKTAGERGTWPVLWRAHAALGRLAYADGRRAEAAAEYDAARAIIERLAAGIPDEPETALNGTTLRAHFVAATATFLPRPRPPTRLRAAKEAYAGLTAREREVAVLVASGKTNREIAALLVVGERTVQTHIGNIFAKLGCSSRAQIAAWAVEQGLATTA
jgi:DNA-binding CsgD family transcriptional regulator